MDCAPSTGRSAHIADVSLETPRRLQCVANSSKSNPRALTKCTGSSSLQLVFGSSALAASRLIRLTKCDISRPRLLPARSATVAARWTPS